MDNKELFTLWAPVDSVWSRWAKPVLFTTIYGPINPPPGLESPPPDVSFLDGNIGDTAVIVNLPGVIAVRYGLALVSRGFRPVPLFNGTAGIGAIQDVRNIAAALINGATVLQTVSLAYNAPPAFLIDSERLNGKALPGQFDNRWVVFPQDFPSGTLLQSQGIRKIILVQPSDSVEADLAEVLTLWIRAGLEVSTTRVRSDSGEVQFAPAEPVILHPVSSSGLMRTLLIFRLMNSFGLRRSNAGGFGSTIPQQTSG